MKKIITAVLSFCILLVCFSGCGTTTDKKGKASIVCTIFPTYDWIYEILGDKAVDFDIHMLGKSGMDLHSYQPTAQDIAMISECDLFVYVGGASDVWAEEIIKNNTNKNMRIVKLFDVIDNKTKVTAEHEHEHEHKSKTYTEYDEHIWLSLRNAATATEVLAQEIATNLDPENSEMYKNNANAYIEKLNLLDKEYKTVVGQSKDKTIIVADRFPFVYLSEDYGINYVAAFLGCSADTDVSFETVIKLSEAADRFSKSTILVTENSKDSIAETVIGAMQNKNVKIAVMNSCQSVEITKGSKETYIEIMRGNLKSLEDALK